MSKRLLSIDIETYSEVDIKSCGSFRYVDDDSFEVLLFGYKYDEQPRIVVDFTAGEKLPESVLNDLYSEDVLKAGWNNAFERYALWKHFGRYLPPEQWEDSMILATQCGLPASLDAAGKALGLSEDQAKMKEGKALIRYFCNPCKPTKTNGGRTRNLPCHAPEKWELFKEYCGQDVEAEHLIRNMLLRWKPSDVEHRFWCLDARINEKGMKVDKQLAAFAVAMDQRYKEELTEKAVEITGLDNPKSVSQIKNWLFDQEGKEFPSLNKKVIADVVSQLQSDKAKEFMALRSELSKSSTAKYDAMLRSVCRDDHIKGCFQFYGANRTGRFAGRLVQLQNLPQNHMATLEEARELVRNGHYSTLKALYDGVSNPLSELIRTALIPEEGHTFLVSDFSAIEARVIAWFAGEQWRLDVFEQGGDIYCASASQMFQVPVEKHGVNSHLRQRGKVAELALGYGGGISAMRSMDKEKMLTNLTDAEMQEIVDLWRQTSPRICALWRSIEKAAIRATVQKGSAVSTMGNVTFQYENGILFMTLPSGRRLAYFGARYEESKRNPWRKELTYMGADQKTKKWTRLSSWGGKLVENLVQATARDVLRDSMLALDAAGFDIRAHVHDEVIVTEPINGRSVEEMSEIMGRPIPWAPGLPLRADGYETPFYKKD